MLVNVLQLLDWQPCLASCQLPSFNWFNVLWGLTETGGDDKLIPNIVSTAVIPRLCAAVRTAWNPFSRSQTHALKASVQELMDVEPSGDAIQVRAGACAQDFAL